ncbi:MAG: glycoside hydrolase family 28 protein [Bacteroidota bacterium]
MQTIFKNFDSAFIWTMIIVSVQLSGCSKASFTVEEALSIEEAAWQRTDAILERIVPPNFKDQVFNVADYGAVGDSITDNLRAINDAIKACHEAGGGKVVFSSGQYFVEGPIHLKSNVNLHIEKDARIFFSSDAAKYLPAVKVRWEGTVCYNYSPLIYGYQLENVAITGEGVIDGAAKDWSIDWRKQQKPDKKVLRQMGNDTIPEHQRVFANGFLDLDGDGKDDGYGDGEQHYLRPTLIELYECKNILIEGVTLRDSPFWTLHPVFSKNITIRNIKVYGEVLNDDGIDPDSCEDVLIEGCTVQTHDDAISIKAGRDQDAWNRMGSKNIIIRNNQLLSGVNALCIGSEMSGGVSNIFAEENTIAGGKHALNFKCNLDRGGQVEQVFIRNTTVESCREALFIFRMDYHGYRGNNFPTKFNDFYVSNIRCKQVLEKPFKIVGVEEEPITRIFLNDIEIGMAGEKSEIAHANDILFHDVKIQGKPWSDVE